MPLKILIIDNIDDILIKKLNEAGLRCEYQPDMCPEKINGKVKEFHGLILRSKIIIDKNFIDKAVNLKFIGRVGSGMENIDVNYATQKNIRCFNSPEGNKNAVAEHALGMLLSLFNKINIANREVKNGIWQREKNTGIELDGKTIGIIGYGNTGSAFAKKLQGFNVEILAFDKYKKKYATNKVKEVSLNSIFDKSDIVSLHLPLTEETRYMIDNAFINKFRKDIYLINTSRGQIVKTKDIVTNLKNKKIKGLCLDVLEYEDYNFSNFFKNPLPEDFNFLKNSDNVILTPHTAGLTQESKIKLARVLADKIIEVFG